MGFLFDRNTWQEIFGSISKNRTRTIITVIGVLWGIFIYIALSGAAKGLDNGFDKVFKTVAINSMFVWAQSTSMPYDGFKTGRPLQLKLEDVKTIQNRIPEVQYIAPRITQGQFGSEPVYTVRGQKYGSYVLNGDYPIYTKISTKKIYDGGRFINQEDIDQARKVIVIGERVEQELYNKDENPVGTWIRVGSVYFQVIGVHKLAQGVSFDSDSAMFIPFTTYQKLYNSGDNIGYMCIAAYDDVDVVQVEKDIKTLLRNIHRVDPKDERAFGSFNLGEAFSKTMGFADGLTFMSLVVGIATILAGVIGIGNILLISVKERTKELGVRRALGATPAEVRNQIVMESVFLTVIAGILGIILGAGVLALINSLTKDIDFPYTNPTVPIPYVIGALVIMVVLGTLIGLIPAQRAVSIRPIEALREE
ncbi:ABC transporter permease [Maribacter arcticus]|jgi:putative ABC transport system permease protein|uniref:Putative ABC transport system permease protein n=1 Tax=Maribacter arcticus TaxID=561365 RepID=A0A1T5AVE0_9FLAO|nr:ABC transporter permease [Maribacter arcticus]SKB38942.1 putative ABC transport system permease protein [Maribacter arcticus]